jgi:hypothetical protein
MELNIKLSPYQPFLIALFIGNSIYTANRVDFPANVMALPMSIFFCLIGIMLIISNYARLDMNKCQIIISCAILLNFTYYTLYEASFGKWLNIAPATIIYILLFVLVIAVIWKISSMKAAMISRTLNFIAIAAVLISFANLGFSIISDAKVSDSVKQSQGFEAQFQQYLDEDLTSTLNTRDFYVIVVDRYPGDDIFPIVMGFNNSGFYENLSSMGFDVLRKSKSNYGSTEPSIPSLLNMDYASLKWSMWEGGYNLENNRLMKFFKSQGFKFVFLPSLWPSTMENDFADVVLASPPVSFENPEYGVFQKIMFFERTFLGKIFYTTMHILFNWEVPSESTDVLESRIREAEVNAIAEFVKNKSYSVESDHARSQFENLTYVPKIAGKKFVFVHINEWPEINKTNKLIESTVSRIIAESEPKPVILLLSDHGRKPDAEELKANRALFAKYACYPNRTLDNEFIQASWYPVNNLLAIYLPDGGDRYIYQNMTPVNVGRMILNYYFGTDFPRAEDKSYWWSSDTDLCEVKHI